MIPTVTSIRKLIGLLHLASPALPIGAYSYSQGLEGAVDAGLIHDAVSARAWIQSGFETTYCFSWLENQRAEAGDEPYRTRKLQEL